MAEQRPDRPTRKPGRAGPGNGTLKFRNGLLGWLLFIGLAVMLVVLVQKSKNQVTEIPLTEFKHKLETNGPNGDLISWMKIGDDNEVTGRFRTPVNCVVSTGNTQ